MSAIDVGYGFHFYIVQCATSPKTSGQEPQRRLRRWSLKFLIMNILVTGANGQLGHEMQRVAKNSNDTFVFTDVADGYDKLDITNLEAIRQMVKEKSIDIIVNCAAYTNVDKA